MFTINLHNPWFYTTFVWPALSAAVYALPDPTLHSKPFYVWFYKWCHFLGINMQQFKQASVIQEINNAKPADKA